MNLPMLLALMLDPIALVILILFVSPKKAWVELSVGILVLSIFSFVIWDNISVLTYSSSYKAIFFIHIIIANFINAVIIYSIKKRLYDGSFQNLWGKLSNLITTSMPKDIFKIDFNKKDNRKANVFGIAIGVIGFILYANQYVQYNNIRGAELIFPILYGGLCYILGLVSGLIFFISRKPIGLVLPFVSLLIHIYFFGDERGDDFDEFLVVAWYLILSTGIVLSMFLITKYTIEYIESGK